MKGRSDKSNRKHVRMKRLLTYIPYCLLFAVYCLLFAISEASGSVVGEIEIKGLYSIGKDEFLYLLDIHPGEQIDTERVRLGIKRAFLKGIFEDISIETSDGEKAKVIIHVLERDYIKNIYIRGNYDLSKKTIKSLFPLKEGQYLHCDKLDKIIQELKPKISMLGFPRADIKAEIERLNEPNRINIRLQVNTGEPDIVRKIDISGTEDDIKAVMKLSEGDIFNRPILTTDIERIKEYYKNKEYFKPVIGPYSYIDGTLHISINPGKRLDISLAGNDNISSKTLLKEMPFFEAEDFNADIVEEAVQRLLSVYHSQGHPFTEISHVITEKDDLISLNFNILEGQQVTTGNITFIGNSLNVKGLKEIMSLKEGKRYNTGLLDSDRDTLQDFYNSLGYLFATIEDFQTTYQENSQTMDIVVKISEGLKTEITNVGVVGANLLSEQELRKVINIKPGDAYNDVDIADARYRVIEFYGNKGFPEVSVGVKKEIDGQKASVTFQIDEGTIVLFGKAIITGNNKTEYVVVKRELMQQEGMPFDYSILTKERQKLYKLGLFSDVDVEVLPGYDDKKDILMRLNESNAGSVELTLGYAEYERFRGVIDLSYRNLWGMNRQASLKLELSSLEKRYILQYYEPLFGGIALPFRAWLLGEERKEINLDTRETRYRLTRHTITVGFEKKLSEQFMSELYYEFSLVNTFDVKPDVILSREDTGTLVISGLRLGLIYDTRDNPFYPRKGILSGISVKFTSPVFFSETDFIKLIFYGNIYHQVTKGIVLAASLRGGFAQGYLKTDELPIVERFFLGGRTTVRGYDQDTLGPLGADGNPIGGNAFLMENLEIRTSLSKSFGLVAFLDGGNVWVKMNEVNPVDFKFTTGLGLRYNTPVGPLRVDYGHKLNREKGESSGELHFSIGHAF